MIRKRISSECPWDCSLCDLPPKIGPVIMLDWNLRKGEIMVRKAYLPEQIINKLREAEILLNQGDLVS